MKRLLLAILIVPMVLLSLAGAFIGWAADLFTKGAAK